jgi:hypothetical protein
LNESRQTASLPYPRAAIFVLQGVVTLHESSCGKVRGSKI